MTLPIHHRPTLFSVELRTSRWTDMVEWYRHVLGLRVLVRVMDDGYALFEAGDTRVAILSRDSAGEASSRWSLGFEVVDLEAAHLRLRDAGAEAMQVGDVRIVASTWFGDGDGGVVVDGQLVEPPYTFVVIGDPPTMSSAMEIPGGVSESVRSKGGTVAVREYSSINVEALHSNSSPRYAQPHPEPTDGDN